jgi:tetratricopeptide (TPR) repeat protein
VIDGAADAPVTSAAVATAAARPDVDAALRAGDYAKAESLLVKEAEARPSSEALRLLGTVFLRNGRPLNAAIALKKAEALEPLDESSRFTLAMAYVAMGKRGWAKPELQKLEAQSPSNALYPYWLARLDYDDNQYAAAVTRLEKAIALDPAFARAYDNLGLCHEALGRFDEARKAWEQALRLNAEQKAPSPWPALNLGQLMTRLDHNDEAEARFRESLRADPAFAPAHYQLGVVLEKKGKSEDARAELEEAARLDPASSETQYALARLYRRAGETARAAAALRRFEELKKQKAPNKDQAGPG